MDNPKIKKIDSLWHMRQIRICTYPTTTPPEWGNIISGEKIFKNLKKYVFPKVNSSIFKLWISRENTVFFK